MKKKKKKKKVNSDWHYSVLSLSLTNKPISFLQIRLWEFQNLVFKNVMSL
jgi:hypothetical protein